MTDLESQLNDTTLALWGRIKPSMERLDPINIDSVTQEQWQGVRMAAEVIASEWRQLDKDLCEGCEGETADDPTEYTECDVRCLMLNGFSFILDRLGFTLDNETDELEEHGS